MIKTYTAKTLDEVLKQACSDLNCSQEELIYEVTLEKKGLFSKKVEIKAYCFQTVIDFVQNYLKTILTDMNLELVEVEMNVQDGRIKANLNTDHNPILIGKGGAILRAINVIVKNAVLNTFKKRYEVDVDISSLVSKYKNADGENSKHSKREIEIKINEIKENLKRLCEKAKKRNGYSFC